ncbi:UvrD-helicase domain-containing protein [Marivirga sp. S37H4]|uniref:DNA 3'-5' helicase n=1 Tax=Marivirga aurantiaca TaxID=2802615 RepID=A0A934X106_9BACT|nr:UvrD-helicase domain-containing protein [Marivirga aurantiaca]MBK6266924.1 UvrD-helicase domain-containing protein [Marivirga aurantiaca]
MGKKSFTVYKSSAGSGKTFTLTREYLKLALISPEHFKKILAVTFTNKATQEMKERIVQNLFQFSSGNVAGMGDQLMALLNLEARQLQTAANNLLVAILHNYSRFSVQTIDRFFQNVMRSFARELSLQGDGELLLNTDEVRNAVVDLLMEDLSHNQPLRDWLLEFSIDKLEQKGKWDVRRDVISFTKELMSDDFKVKEKALGESINNTEKLKSFKSRLYSITSQFEDDLDEIGKEAIRLIESRGLTILDFSYGASSAPNFFNKIQKDCRDFEIKARVIAAIDSGGEKLAAKSSKRKDEIFQLAQDGLLDYFQNAIDYIEFNQKAYISAQNILKNIYLLGISWHFNERMQDYKQEEGIQFLSDTTQFLNEIIGSDPSESPFVYEKMGSFYDHFLMDEFQDTSTLQWQNFKPLIENSLAEGNENLVVGDIKQSIYRWRGGDWRLLLKGLREDIPSHFYEEQSLVHNYRSKPNVIDFNNQLFQQLPGLVKEYALTRSSNSFTMEVENLLDDLAMAYDDVAQKKQNSYPYSGYVALRFFEEEENEMGEKISWREPALYQFVQDIEQLQDAGIKLQDVGILIRSKKEGIEIQDFLEMYQLEQPEKARKYQYNVISDETLLLNSAHIVNFLLNCFRYLYTEDNISLAQIKFYYQKIIGREDLTVHEIVKVDSGEMHLPEQFIETKKQLLSLNLLEMSERLIQIFQLKNIHQEKAYLSAFQDVLLDFGNKGGIPDFMEWWEQNQGSYAIKLQAGENAARMMTIHKAKGLEFKVCMVPLLDWSITHHATIAPTLWVNTENTQFAEVPYLPIKHNASLKNSVFALDYWEEEVKSFLDNMNLLYVALTRAGDALLVNTTAKSSAQYISCLLKKYAEQQTDFWNEESQSLVMGDKADFIQMGKEGKDVDEADQLKTVDLRYYESHQWQEKLQIKQSHVLKVEEGLSKTDIGIQVHNIFSKLNQVEELPVLLRKLEAEEMMSSEDYQRVVQLVEGNLQKESPLLEWFKTDWQVKTEVPVLLTDGSLIRLDRVLVKGSEAKILDFKTGLKDEKHARQVRFYQKSLKKMGYEKVTAHIAYLDPLEIVEAV